MAFRVEISAQAEKDAETILDWLSLLGFRFFLSGKAISCWDFAFPDREKRFPARISHSLLRKSDFPVGISRFLIGKRDLLSAFRISLPGKVISRADFPFPSQEK